MTQLQLASITAITTSALVLLLFRLWLRCQRTRRRAYASRVAVQRSLRASEGEQDAETLLLTHGYRVLVRQPRAVWSPQVDNTATPFDLRADLLVQDVHNDELLIAEVKTGDFAPALSTAATRRQLLEYQAAFAVSAVLLVSPERDHIARVQFGLQTSHPSCTCRHTPAPVRPRASYLLAAGALTVAVFIVDSLM